MQGRTSWIPYSHMYLEESYGSDSDDSGRAEMYEQDYCKTINDCVHSFIVFDHPLFIQIIDTPEFQRLRHLKQCGPCFYVYPTALHTRFEHCLGVYHVAKKMIDVLLKKGADITTEERLCILIAALCHDLGHGPFSHMWERFMHQLTQKTWKHEDMTLQVFNFMLNRNNGSLKKMFQDYNLYQCEIDLIEDLIMGRPREGLETDKHFLFEIVANHRTGIDVDRLEYLMRDTHQFGVGGVDVNYDRVIAGVEIKKDADNTLHLVYREKLMGTLLELFESRAKLHRKCYQHRVCKKIETMLIDSLLEAADYEFVKGVPLRDCSENPETFLKLSDHIFPLMEFSDDPKLARAKEILVRISTRQLYDSVGHFIIDEKHKKELDKSLDQLKSSLRAAFPGKDFSFGIISVSLSSGGNPLQNIPFRSKSGDVDDIEERKKLTLHSSFYNWKEDPHLSTTQLFVYSKTKYEEDNFSAIKVAVKKLTQEYLNVL